MPDAARSNPDWAWDETVLACDLVAQNDGQPLGVTDQRVVELSRLLQRMSLHPPEARLESFRNEDGVSRKTHNLASSASTWTKWRSNSSRRDREVMAQFEQAPDAMRRIAQGLRQNALNDTPEDYSSPSAFDEESVLEGRYLLRFHLVRERSHGLRQRKLRSVLAHSGSLACEVCDLDFAQFYGDRGQGYIECHHVEPLHSSGQRATRISDLALLCSNCHRMIHRRPPWPTPAELRAIIEAQQYRHSVGDE